MFTTKKVISKYLPLEETIKTHFIAAKVVIKWAKNSTNLNEYLPVVNFWLDHLARSVSISNDHYHMLTYSCNNIKLAKRTIFSYSYRIFIWCKMCNILFHSHFGDTAIYVNRYYLGKTGNRTWNSWKLSLVS